MARKAAIEKQKKRERLVKLKWDKRQELKKTIKDLSKSYEEKMIAVDQLNAMVKNSSPIKLRNRCVITGRARGYLRKFGISRICFRERASAGLIPGIVKASW